jgi:hypothetical protein
MMGSGNNGNGDPQGPGGYGPPGQGGYGPPAQGGYAPPGQGAYGPPPAGYGMPGGPGSPMGGGGPAGGVGQLAAITERGIAKELVLTMVTCGLYGMYWFYVTDDELARASGDPEISATKDLLLTFVTCGVWAIYCYYRNAKKCHELSTRYGLNRQDQSTTVVLTMALGVGFIGWYLLQVEYNALAAAGRGQAPR